MDLDEVRVLENPGSARFEVTVGQQVAGYVQYRDRADERSFVHTVIDPAYEGHGLASRLISAALADARRRGAAVFPYCPFVRDYLLKHPQDLDLVPMHGRRRFGLPEEVSRA
jgi:predicted GNAT family acetyltransferase